MLASSESAFPCLLITAPLQEAVEQSFLPAPDGPFFSVVGFGWGPRLLLHFGLPNISESFQSSSALCSFPLFKT